MTSFKIAVLVSVVAAPAVMAQGESYVIRGGTVHTMAGVPIEEASMSPGRASSTFIATRRSVRPIVAFARLPGPSTP